MLLTSGIVAAFLTLGGAPQTNWQAEMQRQLPLLGHRNWIVIADSAYPWQTSPGITTIETNSDQISVLKAALAAVGKAPHVRPTIFTDAELPFVPEAQAKGVTAYRTSLAKILQGKNVTPRLHEKIIGDLDEAGKTFHVLLLKTKMTIPYTSVFLRLDCAYWSDAAEKSMRDAMKKKGK